MLEWIQESETWCVIVEHWDRPDWWADTLEEAKAIAQEREDAPPISPSQ